MFSNAFFYLKYSNILKTKNLSKIKSIEMHNSSWKYWYILFLLLKVNISMNLVILFLWLCVFLTGFGLWLVEYLFSSLSNKLLNRLAIGLWNNPALFIKNTVVIRSKYVLFYCCFCLEGNKIQKCSYGKTSILWTQKSQNIHLSLNILEPPVLFSNLRFYILFCDTGLGLCKVHFFFASS